MTHPFAQSWNDDTELYPMIADLLTGYHTILDAGAGDGQFSYFLAERGHQVIGVDNYFGGHAEQLPPETENAHFLLADATNLPFGYQSFDAVVAISMLHETNASLAIGQLRKVLKAGGLLVIVDSAAANPAQRLAQSLRRAWVGRGKTRKPSQTLKPELTWKKTRQLVESGLPGCSWRRVGTGRYLATWTMPKAG